ncbi:MAG: hypothetical protein ACI97A_000326 [Planctomycetota bacterium]|jgi:hypothetical protein
MNNHRIMTLLVIATLAMLTSCGTAPKEEEPEKLPEAKTSPLGIDQPDPVLLARSAIDAYKRGKVWEFFSFFGFADGKTGVYFSPANVEEDPFFGTRIEELRPLAQSLFPLMDTPSSTIEFGQPMTVRNRPLTVEVPFSVVYDFESLSAEERMRVLTEVNTALASQGQRTITFEEYANKVRELPNDLRHRFIYQKKRWYIDGGVWRPYRVKR